MRQDLREVALALHAERRELGDVELARRPLVAMLDEQPRAAFLSPVAGITTLGADEHPRSFQLVSLERELQIALLDRLIHIVNLRRPCAAVPQHDDAGAIAGGDDAFELAVVERVIFDVHREPLRRRIERGSFRDRPGEQHAVVLESKVVVQVTGEVLLHAEEARGFAGW